MSVIVSLAAIVWGASFIAIVVLGVLCGVSAPVRKMIWGDEAHRGDWVDRLER